MTATLLALVSLTTASPAWAGTSGALVKTPNDGTQPQALVDTAGTIHLLYFKGDAKAGDLYYVTRGPGKNAFSKPLRVNSAPGTAIAVGTIRGGQIALGKAGRVHVVWNGATPIRPEDGCPLYYTRLDGGTFEPQRSMIHVTNALDGGGSVAADSAGNVAVVWHGHPKGAEPGEGNRRVFVAHSTDEGKNFTPEVPAWDQDTGACGCCGLKAAATSAGELFILYRSATNRVNRDMFCLHSAKSASMTGSKLQEWKIGSCPMSSMSLIEGPNGMVGAWETEGSIYFGRLGTSTAQPLQGPGRSGQCKHPSLAFNESGEMVLAWTEGTGWQRGGALAWQVYDAQGQPTGEKGRLEGAIPVWGLPSAVATKDGFVIFH